MSNWINVAAVSKILVFGLVLGGAVPAMFALGVRLNISATEGTGAVSARSRLLTGLSWVLFGLALVIVVTGVLYIANNFIGAHTGLYLFGTGKRH